MTGRNGFYAGLLAAAAIGVYLLQLWQPDRQVELHSVHFLHAAEQKNWGGLNDFIDAGYHDQWGNDRSLVLARMREVLSYTRNLRIESHDAVSIASGETGEWRARLTATGDDSELMAMVKERINTLPEPFRLQWRRQSWKPWDWRLLGVSNAALELPEL